MRIRSITSFYDPGSESLHHDLEKLARFSGKLQETLNNENMPVQSTRLATIPFPFYLPEDSTQACKVASRMQSQALDMGWQYLSLGPALPGAPDSYTLVPAILQAAESVFCGAVIAEAGFVHPRAIRKSANIINKAANITKDGFTNLRFAALANVASYAPFLPAAYAKPGNPPSISIAVECADVVLNAFKNSKNLQESRQMLINQLEDAADAISSTVDILNKDFQIEFRGFDFSPAPFPEDWCSLGGAVEALGLEHIGGLGALSLLP